MTRDKASPNTATPAYWRWYRDVRTARLCHGNAPIRLRALAMRFAHTPKPHSGYISYIIPRFFNHFYDIFARFMAQNASKLQFCSSRHTILAIDPNHPRRNPANLRFRPTGLKKKRLTVKAVAIKSTPSLGNTRGRRGALTQR